MSNRKASSSKTIKLMSTKGLLLQANQNIDKFSKINDGFISSKFENDKNKSRTSFHQKFKNKTMKLKLNQRSNSFSNENVTADSHRKRIDALIRPRHKRGISILENAARYSQNIDYADKYETSYNKKNPIQHISKSSSHRSVKRPKRVSFKDISTDDSDYNDNTTNYSETAKKSKAKSILKEVSKHLTSPNVRERKNSDYGLNDFSHFRVTIDKDSTTVTDMGLSGISFIEVRKPNNHELSDRPIFPSKHNIGNLDNNLNGILPFIHQYRRVMKSSDCYSDLKS